MTLQIHGNDFGSYSTLVRKPLDWFEYRSDKIRIRFQQDHWGCAVENRFVGRAESQRENNRK